MSNKENELDLKIKEIKECQESKKIKSCSSCNNEYYSCLVRLDYVKSVYTSMNPDLNNGGFEFN